MSRLRTAGATDTGYLRVTNQDRALMSSDLAAVADGMGGHLGGEVAARMAVEELFEAYRRDRTTDGLVAAVRAANDAVYRRSKADRNLRGMGTTLTAAALVGDERDGQLKLALVNVGDSRAYLVDWRERQIHKLTEDHSVVEEMVRSGELTPDEAAIHPHRHILTRALGIEPGIEPDCWELDLDPGSRLLLCSDGLTNELEEEEIGRVLLDEADAVKAANELVRLALHRGGTDNVTVVVVDVVGGDETAGDEDAVLVPEAETDAPGAVSSAGATGTSESTETIAVMPTALATPRGGTSASLARPLAATSASLAAPLGEPADSLPLPNDTPRAARSRPMLLVRTKRPKRFTDRIVTLRVVLFVLVFTAVLGATAGVVVWYNKASFFVGLDRGRVTIFQGRPGGLLWFKPSVVERTSLTPADLLASSIVYLKQGLEESSYQNARKLVRTLATERVRLPPSQSTTTTTGTRASSQAGATVITSAPAQRASPTTINTMTPATTTTTRPKK